MKSKIQFFFFLSALLVAFHVVVFAVHDESGAIDFPPTPKLKKPLLLLGPAGERFNFVTCQKGNLAFTMAESTVPPGMGPMPHIHHYTNEWFYAAEGGIQLYSSDKNYDSVDNPPDAAKGTLATVYLIPMKPKHVVYGPKYHIHGFNNMTTSVKPLTFVWKADPISPKFDYNDGGIRAYFEAVAQRIEDPNHVPQISDKNRELFVTQAPKFGINQSFYFLQYINRVEIKIPESLHHTNTIQLNEILDMIREYNSGSKEVTCR
jgi:hypothetical protein